MCYDQSATWLYFYLPYISIQRATEDKIRVGETPQVFPDSWNKDLKLLSFWPRGRRLSCMCKGQNAVRLWCLRIVLQNETWNLLNILVHPHTKSEFGSGNFRNQSCLADDTMISIGLFQKYWESVFLLIVWIHKVIRNICWGSVSIARCIIINIIIKALPKEMSSILGMWEGNILNQIKRASTLSCLQDTSSLKAHTDCKWRDGKGGKVDMLTSYKIDFN